MTQARWPVTVIATAALAFAGCGGGDSDSGGSGGSGGGGEAQAGPAKVFSDTCGGCHTLGAAGTQGQSGPNLDELKPDAARVKTAIEEGPSIMPADLLKGAQADEVAKYVADNAGG